MCVRVLYERVRERESESESKSIGQFINVYRVNTNRRANPLCQRYFKGIELKKKKKRKTWTSYAFRYIKWYNNKNNNKNWINEVIKLLGRRIYKREL